MKKILLMLILFFICGFVSADLCVEELKESNALLQLEVYEGYANAKLAFKDIFWNIFYERSKLFGIIILLCFTPLREKLSVILFSIFSFIWGFFFMSCIVELGVAGVVVALVSVLPHGIMYAGVVSMILRKHKLRSFHQRDRMLMNVGTYIFLVLLFITGCVVESLVGTHFIPWVIRLSFI